MSDPDYSARAAYKQNRALVWELTKRIDAALEGPPPEDCHFQHVGNVVAARTLLEKALLHLQPKRNPVAAPVETCERQPSAVKRRRKIRR